MKTLLCILTVILIVGINAFGAEPKPTIDYQKTAEGAGWGWSKERADPFYGISQAGDKYDIILVSDHKDRSFVLTIKIMKDGKDTYSWKGHSNSVFRILDDRLYFVRFHPSSSGGSVVAVDLTSGKELWESPLRGIGPIEHSAYSNLVTIDANDDVVSVFGNESMGRYFEIKDARTGETVGHKVFARPISFDTHDGYFVSNKFEPDAPTSFVVLKDQKAFDAVFGVAMVMGDKSHRLPPDAFETKVVAAAIHRGKAFWSYKVESVEVEGKTLIVKYTTNSTPNKTAEFACPLIVSVPKVGYTAVQFVEDGKVVKVIDQHEQFGIKCEKNADTIKVDTEGGTIVLSVTSESGIGGATIERKADHWPEKLTLRLHLRGLESLSIVSGDLRLGASVASHSGNPRRLWLTKDGKEGPQLEKDSPYWMEIMTVDATGKSIEGLPEPGGYFEMVVPQALLTDGTKAFTFKWVDFFR